MEKAKKLAPSAIPEITTEREEEKERVLKIIEQWEIDCKGQLDFGELNKRLKGVYDATEVRDED